MSENMEKSNYRLSSLLEAVPADRLKTLYERHGIPSADGPEKLGDEIRLDGSNSIASLFRGKGVDYLEMVRNVADTMDVPYTEEQDEESIERDILGKTIQQYLENASKVERKEIEKILESAGKGYNNISKDNLLISLSGGALALLIGQIGAKAVSKIVQRIVTRLIGLQVGKETGKRAMQAIGFAIPLLNATMIAWTAIEMAGPAYRKTVPSVIEIAMIRLEFAANGRD